LRECNLLDGVPKVDGFFSLTPRESDAVLSLVLHDDQCDYPPLEDFHGRLANHRAGRMFQWQARTISCRS
jgi:hypothetical protein